MNQNAKKGFTLIEVIASVAIFAIISVGFITMFSTVFITTFKSKEYTQNAFMAQQALEQSIAAVKSDLEEGITPEGYESFTVTLFSGSNQRTVTAYSITQTNSAGPMLEMVVSSVRPPELRVPTITSDVVIKMSSNLTIEEYPNVSMSGLSLDVEEDVVVDNPGLLIRYVYHWYISKDNEFIPSAPPVFPDDYEIVTRYSSKKITTVPEEFAGRFIRLVVIPVGEKGQMGSAAISNAVYFSAFPLSSNLSLHLDASYIDPNDTTNQVRNETAGSVISSYVKKWIAIDDNGSHPSQNNSSNQPKLITDVLNGTEGTYTIQGIEGKPASNNGTLVTPTSPSIGSISNLTVYFAAKFNDAYPSNTTIFQSKANAATGNRWELKTNSTGNLELVRYLNSSNSSSSILTCADNDYRGSKWRIFKLSIYQDVLAIDVDGVTVCSAAISTTTTLQLTDFKINFDSRMSLGEVAVFSAKHTTDSTEYRDMLKYLKKKYKQLD